MIRFLLIRLVLPLVFLWFVRAMIRTILAALRNSTAPATQNRQPSSTPSGGELKKDPVCGTYVSTATSLTRTVNGSVLHFCSEACRDKYGVA